MRALLDVNVWIALLDANHTFAERANGWFARERPAFATCPIVENGVVRIIASPGYSTLTRQPIAAVSAMLAGWPHHSNSRTSIAITSTPAASACTPMPQPSDNFCLACYNGQYTVPISAKIHKLSLEG